MGKIRGVKRLHNWDINLDLTDSVLNANHTRNSSAELGGTSGGRSGSILHPCVVNLHSPFPCLHLTQLTREYISRRVPLGIDFFILYRSKLHLENEFQVDLRCARTPSRAATAIVIMDGGE